MCRWLIPFSLWLAIAGTAPGQIRPAMPPASAKPAEALESEAPLPESVPPGPKVNGLELSPADPKVKPDDGYVLIEAKTTGAVVKWIVVGSAPVKYTAIDKGLVVSVPPPGGFVNVYAYTALDGKPTDYAVTRIETETAMPPPAPPAPPAPAPASTWAAGPLNVIIIDDAKTRPDRPFMANILASKELRDSISKAGHKFVVFDNSDKALDTYILRPHVGQAGGAPCLLLMNQKGYVGLKIPCPQTPAGVVEAINQAVKTAGKGR